MQAADRPFSLRLRLSECSRPLLLPGRTVRLAVIPQYFNAFPSFPSTAMNYSPSKSNSVQCDGWWQRFGTMKYRLYVDKFNVSTKPCWWIIRTICLTITQHVVPFKTPLHFIFQSFIFSEWFILIRPWWIRSLSQESWAQGIRKYTMDRTLVHPGVHLHNFSVINWPIGMVFGGRMKPENLEEIHTENCTVLQAQDQIRDQGTMRWYEEVEFLTVSYYDSIMLLCLPETSRCSRLGHRETTSKTASLEML